MIIRSDVKLKADPKKVVLQFFKLGKKRSKNVINRVLSLEEKEVSNILNDGYNEFRHRHRYFEEILMSHYKNVKDYIPKNAKLTNDRKMLIGSYFSKEYSIEAAALFNPSIVPHRDQSNMEPGNLRFVLSLRATGEGHISSIEFREGNIDKNGDVRLYEQTALPTLPQKTTFSDEEIIDKRKLREYLSTEEINDALATNYVCEYSPEVPLSERVLFPYSQSESMGMEDLRLVKFSDSGREIYYGTYTAFNGRSFRSQLIETKDFRKFQISSLYGSAINNKGLALFPRKVKGKYVITSRQDGENLYLMYSDNLYYWNDKEILKTPKQYWEYIQMGNCGSPIETEYGWLLITHSVGPFRKYIIGAVLLDLDNPSKIIGILNEALIEPNSFEREGYVPNVVYSCGSLIHNNNLIIPYAISDSTCRFAKIEVKELMKKMIANY